MLWTRRICFKIRSFIGWWYQSLLLMTSMFNSGTIMWGEFRCWSLLGLNFSGLKLSLEHSLQLLMGFYKRLLIRDTAMKILQLFKGELRHHTKIWLSHEGNILSNARGKMSSLSIRYIPQKVAATNWNRKTIEQKKHL